jgi:hypothetical protein
MYSPVSHAGSNIMTRKNKQNNKVKQLTRKMKKVTVSKPKPSRPFRDVGGTLGGALGGVFGNHTLGNNIGKWLGTGIGSIFGSGDYTTTGQPPDYNVFSGQVPQFSSTHATNIVCHREYVTDIVGASIYTNRLFPLNPGIATTFPWLSSIAAGYQQYKFHGIVIEFRPLVTDYVTNGAPGVMVLATEYDASNPGFTSRQQAENSEFAVSTKPTLPLLHMIECNPAEQQMKLYNVRTGPLGVNDDLKLFDLGLTQVITQLNPTQLLGEIWISYCVEFFKPIIPVVIPVGGAYHLFATGVSSTQPFGTSAIRRSGSLLSTEVFTAGIQSITLTLTPGRYYQVSYYARAGTSITGVTIGATGMTAVSIYEDTPQSNYAVATTGSTKYVLTLYYLCTNATVVFTAAATVTGSTSMDFVVVPSDITT